MIVRAIHYLRWRAHLASLRWHVDGLETIEGPEGRNFIICGLPRSGTSLLCGALLQPPRIVTVMEPWDGLRMPPAELFASLREEIRETGEMSRGKLDLDALRDHGRIQWTSEGSQSMGFDDFGNLVLGVKWPTFWQYLGRLPTVKFLVCIRDPYEVVASFKRVGGRLGNGLEYAVRFNRTMNRELRGMAPTDWERRVFLYEYIASRALDFASEPNVMLVRFERWFDDPDGLVRQMSRFLDVDIDPPKIQIRRPNREPSLDRRERDLIAEVCDSARTLGYV